MPEITLNIKSIGDLAESAASILDRAVHMTKTAQVLLEHRDRDFDNVLFKEQTIAFQLDSMYEFLTQCRNLFDDSASDFIKNRKRGCQCQK